MPRLGYRKVIAGGGGGDGGRTVVEGSGSLGAGPVDSAPLAFSTGATEIPTILASAQQAGRACDVGPGCTFSWTLTRLADTSWQVVWRNNDANALTYYYVIKAVSS